MNSAMDRKAVAGLAGQAAASNLAMGTNLTGAVSVLSIRGG